MKEKTKHLLVIRLSAMGDVAMVAVVLRALMARHPSLKITVLSKSFLAPLFEEFPEVSFYAADTQGRHKGFRGIYRLYKELKPLNFDGIADLHNVLRSRLLSLFFFGTKTFRIDKGRAEKKALIRLENKVFTPLKTSHERAADVFRKFELDVDLSQTPFPTPPPLSAALKTRIQFKVGMKYIGIAPFAQHASKTYPLNLMKVVLLKLSETPNVQLLLFGGGKEEITALNALEEKIPNVQCMAGKLKLKDELLLISHLNCMLSMDSGNGHFAALYGVPTLTLWGGTHPYAGFAPFQQTPENNLLPDLEKYPHIPYTVFGNKMLPGYENVMQTISPETVVAEVLRTCKNKI
jgi:ADP-heptose:LPS heptosyltransferase